MPSVNPETTRHQGATAILRVVLVYAVFSALWILFSDRLALLIAQNSSQLVLISMFKGWLFVVVTSLLLYRLMHRQLLPRRQPGERRNRSRAMVAPVLVLGVAIVGLTGVGMYQAHRGQEDREKARMEAVAELKARQITDWVRERVGDGAFVSTSKVWSKAFEAWKGHGDLAEREHLYLRLEEFSRIKGFRGVLVMDSREISVIRGEGAPETLAGQELRAAAQASLGDRRVRLVGPYLDPAGVYRLDVVAPLPLLEDRESPVVVLLADPAAYLLPILQSWPVPSATGEAFLFRREGDRIHYLSQSRLSPVLTPRLTCSQAEPTLLEAKFLRAQAASGQYLMGTDYGGGRVMGVVQAIPGTDWFLVAKTDEAEVNAGARGQITILGLAGVLGLLLAVLANHLFHQQRVLAEAEREQRHQAERLQALGLLDSIASGSSDAIYAKDRHGRFLLFNPEAERLFGRKAEEVLGRDTMVVRPGPDDSETPEEDQAILRDGRTITLEEVRETPSGPRTFLVTKGPLRDAQGGIMGHYGIAKDITERVRAERERQELQAEIQSAQRLDSIGRLAGGVAHDFNNMLGVIVANAEIGLMKPGGEGAQERFEEIRKAALRSADLTRQLLAFARKQTVSPKVLNLNDALPGMLQMLGRLIGENIVLDYEQRAGLWPIRMDPTQVDQILANLAVNARDAIAGVGRLRIHTENLTLEPGDPRHAPDAPHYVLLEVSDTGCGMDAEQIEHIFEPFFTTKGVGKGTGLGLATVYGIVKQNGGFIDVRSTPGEGTSFRVHLPRFQGDAEAAPVHAAPAAPPLGRERILVVEDEPMNLQVSVMLLESLGYQVTSASSPGEALRILERGEGDVNLLLTDIIMPEMNGRELADRALLLRPNLKCLFMSGYTDDIIAHQGELAPDVKFLGKPFTLEALGASLREVLDA